MKAKVVALFCVFLSACAMPSKEELANANYGAPPQDYEEQIKNHMRSYLKDPLSAQYRLVNAPYPDYKTLRLTTRYGHAVCYLVNAKNSYGAYVGETRYYFFFGTNGRLIWAEEDSNPIFPKCKR